MKRLASLLALAPVIALTGCGGDGEPTASTAAEAEQSGALEVGITDFKYDPPAVTVAPGTEITFTNSDVAPHTATADEDSPAFDTKTLRRGDSATVTFDEPGTYAYFCRFHAFMKASIEVN